MPYYLEPNGYDVSYVDENRTPYYYDRPNSTNGSSQVLVRSMHYDEVVGGYVDGPAWTLDYNTSITAEPTPNVYSVSFGECSSYIGVPFRRATATVYNEVGADGRYIGSVYPEASAMGGGVDVIDTQTVYRVYDGESVSVPLITFDETMPGLTPGYTYQVTFWLADSGNAGDDSNPTRWAGATQSVYVPECGDSPPGHTQRPRASIKVVHHRHVFQTVKVVLGSRQATRPTTYQVERRTARGRTIHEKFTTRYKVVLYRQARSGDVFSVQFGAKVVRKKV